MLQSFCFLSHFVFDEGLEKKCFVSFCFCFQRWHAQVHKDAIPCTRVKKPAQDDMNVKINAPV